MPATFDFAHALDSARILTMLSCASARTLPEVDLAIEHLESVRVSKFTRLTEEAAEVREDALSRLRCKRGHLVAGCCTDDALAKKLGVDLVISH